MLVDVHCHLDFPQFDSDRHKVIERAREEGILIINSGMGPEGIGKTIRLAREYDNVLATLGLAPQEFDRDALDQTVKLIREHRKEIVGLGEVGLDYYWVKRPADRELELENLRLFMGLSAELNLPLIIHSRDAEEDVINLLKENGVCALLHCFSGSVKQAEEAISLGCLISIPTSVLYSKKKQGMVEKLPLDSIVLETDAPYLSPKPKTRNEPTNIILTRNLVSEIKNLDEDIVEEATTKNAERFFDLKVTPT